MPSRRYCRDGFFIYFHWMNSICLNGKILPADKPALMADNRGYRYGDGLFETMKMINGKIVLEKYHFERLFNGIKLLKLRVPLLFKASALRRDILKIGKKNKCDELGRIRLSVEGTPPIQKGPPPLLRRPFSIRRHSVSAFRPC